MSVDPKKVKDDLASVLRSARSRADAYILAEAERIKRETAPEIPIGVLVQTICRRGNCPCSYALSLLEEEARGVAQASEEKVT